MNKEEFKIHRNNKKLGSVHRRVEYKIIEGLQATERTKLFKKLNCNSLFTYACKEIGFTDSVAYTFITVARKASEIGQLQTALRLKWLTVSKASRICSSLCAQNATGLIEFAKNHTCKELEAELARINPKRKKRDSVRPISATEVRVSYDAQIKTSLDLKRIQTLRAQCQLPTDLDSIHSACYSLMLDKIDPVRKAERAKPRKTARKVTVRGVRTPLTSEQKHSVFRRDQGRCTFMHNGKRCNEERWVEVHHKVRVVDGGGNEPENLVTLCGYHHDVIHQIPLDPKFKIAHELSSDDPPRQE